MQSTEKPHIPWVPWKTSDVLIGVLLVLVGIVVLVTVIALVAGSVDSAPAVLITLAGTSGLLLLISLALGPLKHRVAVRELGLRPFPSTGAAQVALSIAVFLAILVFNGIYGVVVSQLGWDVLEPSALPFKLDFSPALLAFTGVLVIGVGPFAEEVFFRGFALPGLARRSGPLGAVLVSSLLFGLAHANVALFLPAFAAGLLLAWLYLRTGSLLGCVLAHGMQNAVAFAVAVSG